MIKISKLFRYIVIFLLLIENCFFYLIDIPEMFSPYMSYFIKVLVGFISLCIFLCAFASKKLQWWMGEYKSFLTKYIWIFLFSILAVVFLTFFSNGASLKSSFITSCSYYVVLLCFPILLSMKDDEDTDRIFSLINTFTLIMYLLVIAQSFLYDNQGIIILKYLNDGVSLRNDRIRMDILPFGNIMLIYNFYIVIYKKEERRIIHLLNLVLGLFALFYIEQTRAMIVIIMACFAFFLLAENTTLSKIVKNILLVGIVVTVVINTGWLDNFLSTFSSSHYSSEYSGSSIARDYATAYYMSVFTSNPLFGFGFTSSESVIRGTRGIAYVDDVGIWGQMAKLGVFAFIIYIPILIRFGQIALYMRKHTGSNLYIALFFYILMSSLTLMVLDNQRIMLLPFLIAIFEFAYRKEKANNSLKFTIGGGMV